MYILCEGEMLFCRPLLRKGRQNVFKSSLKKRKNGKLQPGRRRRLRLEPSLAGVRGTVQGNI